MGILLWNRKKTVKQMRAVSEAKLLLLLGVGSNGNITAAHVTDNTVVFEIEQK